MIKISKIALLFSIILLTGTYSCKKNSTTPTVKTETIKNILPTSATSGGMITDDSGAVITARGVCWSTTVGPTIGNSKSSNGSGTGTFTSELTDLKSLTVYYVRAYITVGTVTTYGDELTFTTTW